MVGAPGGSQGSQGGPALTVRGRLAAHASQSPGGVCGHACVSESHWGGAEVATTTHRMARPRLPPRLSPQARGRAPSQPHAGPQHSREAGPGATSQVFMSRDSLRPPRPSQWQV